MRQKGYVQYGCGDTCPPSWTNFDVSPTLRIQKLPVVGRWLTHGRAVFPKDVLYGDVVAGLPIEPASCDAIYCAHVLEHLSLEDLRTALRNTYAYLKPGGIFRCVLPDLRQIVQWYLDTTVEQPAIEFMETIQLGYHQRPRGLMGVLREMLGSSRHLWMWDYQSLAIELGRVGFVDVRRATIFDSSEPRFREVEQESRWAYCLGIESRKAAAP
jgi:predicted SAM-dependent methyltransferase